MFPKRKSRSIPSIRAVSWDARFTPGQKSSIPRPILVHFTSRLAGSIAIDVLQWVVYFLDLISNIFVRALFGRANKIMLM